MVEAAVVQILGSAVVVVDAVAAVVHLHLPVLDGKAVVVVLVLLGLHTTVEAAVVLGRLVLGQTVALVSHMLPAVQTNITLTAVQPLI